MELQKKLYASVIKQPANDTTREITFVVSDETPDRDGDIIEAGGWDFSEFMKNALFMGFHDYEDFSYGKFTRIEKDLRSNPRRVLGTVRFPTIQELCPSGEVSEHAKNVDMMYNMYKNGYLNAVSVGCIYKQAEPRKDYPEGTPDYARGRRVTSASLLEVSAVPIPANPNALVLMSGDSSIDKKMVEYVKKSFNEHIEEKKAIPFKHYPLAPEDEKWDGPEVVAASDVEDLKVICTWKADKPDADLTKGDFKLPHHLSKADGYKTVKAGVVAAGNVISGSRGGASIPQDDLEKVKNHLESHYHEFDLLAPWENPEKTCEYCGKEFSVKKSRADKAHFCSRECYGNWISENIVGEKHHNYDKGIEKVCKNCGGHFYVKKWRIESKDKNRGVFCSRECQQKYQTGENNPNYTGSYDYSEREEFKKSRDWENVRKSVMERDGYSCWLCGATGKMNVHHIKSYKEYPELRLDATNLVTLCEDCHKTMHKGREFWESMGVNYDSEPTLEMSDTDKSIQIKEGRRLSAATLALVDELKAGLVEFDEAIVALQGCRRNMEKRIKALESGSSEEPDDMGNDDEEKSVVIHFVD